MKNLNKRYENVFFNFKKFIFDKFYELSFNEHGRYLIQMFLEHEKKYINTNDSFIFKILNKSIINNKNIIDYCNNKFSSFVTQKFLEILYNEKLNKRYENKIRGLNKIIFINFINLSFSENGNYAIQMFLEYEKKKIKKDGSLILNILNKSIINKKNVLYYLKNKYASFVIKKFLSIINNIKLNAHYKNKIRDLNKVVFDNSEESSLISCGLYLGNNKIRPKK